MDIYNEHITPYALQVVGKLSETFLKLIGSTSQDKEDSEMMMTAHGCLTAINNILLYSMDEAKQAELFLQLEGVLQEPILKILDGNIEDMLEDAFTTVSYLVRGQKTVSQRMWQFYNHILVKALKGEFNENFMNVVVVMQNFLSRGGDQIMQIDFNGKNGVNLLLDYALYIRAYTKQEDDRIS